MPYLSSFIHRQKKKQKHFIKNYGKKSGMTKLNDTLVTRRQKTLDTEKVIKVISEFVEQPGFRCCERVDFCRKSLRLRIFTCLDEAVICLRGKQNVKSHISSKILQNIFHQFIFYSYNVCSLLAAFRESNILSIRAKL